MTGMILIPTLFKFSLDRIYTKKHFHTHTHRHTMKWTNNDTSWVECKEKSIYYINNIFDYWERNWTDKYLLRIENAEGVAFWIGMGKGNVKCKM